jgi:hypothetical protein
LDFSIEEEAVCLDFGRVIEASGDVLRERERERERERGFGSSRRISFPSAVVGERKNRKKKKKKEWPERRRRRRGSSSWSSSLGCLMVPI